MKTIFQRLIHASKLQRRSICSSKTNLSKVSSATEGRFLAHIRYTTFYILNSKFLSRKLSKLSITFLLLTSMLMNKGWGQVSNYTFTQSTSTYSEFSDGTLIANNTNSTNKIDDNVYDGAIGFTFRFNGVDYTAFKISANGFITFGATSPEGSSPISGSTAYAGAISGFGLDLLSEFWFDGTNGPSSSSVTSASSTQALTTGQTINEVKFASGTTISSISGTTLTMSNSSSNTASGIRTFETYTGSIRVKTSGSVGSRKCTIQFRRFSPYATLSTAGNVKNITINFQIILNETSNVIDIIYGNCSNGNAYTHSPQIGLRGSSNSDYNNRTKSTNNAWLNNTSSGVSNSATVNYNSSSVPATNTKFTWTPPAACSVGAASSSPTPCINTLMTSVTHATSGVTGITSSTGLPSGVSAAYNSNTITISGTPSQSGTFNYTITPTGCATTASGTITVAAASVGGSVTGGTTPICQGSGTGTMTQGSHTGSIVKWQKRVNSGAWSDIVNTATTYSETPSSSGTWEYRAEIKNGACTSVFSTARSIAVDAVPSAPGSVTTSNVDCTSLTLNWGAAANASGYEIQVSTQSNFSNSVGSYNGSTDVGNVTTASITGLSANTQYWIRVRARNGSTPCRSGWTNLGTTSVTTVGNTSVSTQPSNATICFGGSNSPSVVVSGGVTLSYQWQFNNSGTWGSVSNGTPTNATYSNPNSNNTFSIGGNISAGSYEFRCVVSSTGGCNSTNSNIATLTINADPSAPTATKSPNSASACAGATLTLSSPTYGADAGMSCGFEYSSSTDGSSWSSYGDAIPSFIAVAGTNGIRIRVKGGCGNGCNSSNYTEYTWTVTALPTITTSSGASRCGTGTLGISATASAGSIEWFNAASNGTSQGSSSSAATWTTPNISSTTTYYAEAVNGSCRSAARTEVTATVNTAAYRSAATGNWSDATKWEISCDGTNWTAANVAPGSGDGAISIRNGHNITVAASTTLDELTIDAGATLTVNASQTLTIANGTGDDLTVNGSLVVNGTISNSGAIKLNSGGLYNHANGTSIPAGITFASGSTLEVSSSATCTNIHSYASRPHHLTWSSSGAMPTGMTSSGQFTMCNGNFTMSAGTFLVTENTSSFSSTNYDLTIGSNFYLNGGTIEITDNGGGANSSGKGKLIVSGDFVQTSGIFEFSNTGSNQVNTSNLEVFGNFTHTGGNFQVTNAPTNSVTITLSKTASNQTLESTGQTGSMIFNVAGSNAQCVVAASKTFVQSANTTFIVAAGTSTPDLLINGTFTRTGTSLTTSGTMSVASGGTYQHNCNGQSLPSATWDAASTCNITGTSSTTPTNFGQTFGNLTVNCSGTATTDANSSVAGNLTITGGTLTVGNNFTLGITGNSSITGTLSLGGTGAKTFTGNTTINSSGTLSVSGSGAYSMAGNFTNNGTFTPGTAILTLNGGGAQTLDGTSALSFSNVTINKSGGTLTAAKDMTITGTLTLTNGILDMNSKTLTMGTASANGTITGGSASSYIVALDGGTPSKLIHRVNSTSNSTYSFPIGTGSKYTPVTVVMKGGTLSNASIQVWTKNSKVTGMSDAMSCHLNRSWFVEPTGITTPTYDIQLGFASGDFTGDAGFDLNPVKLSSGVWYKPSGSLLQNGTIQGTTIATNYVSPSTPATSSGTVYWNGLTSFSEFGGGGGSAPLPVELVSFSGACEDGKVILSWQTASEHNSSHFDVEKSRDGENWQVIETIPAAGNSNELFNYETFDQVTNLLNYYRLNQVDIDGTNRRYDPIAVSCEEAKSGVFMTYPNPSANGFNVLVNDEDLSGVTTLNIYSASGSLAMTKIVELKEGINVFMIHDKLLPGAYFIELKDQNNKTKVIKHLVN